MAQSKRGTTHPVLKIIQKDFLLKILGQYFAGKLCGRAARAPSAKIDNNLNSISTSLLLWQA
jgi:hypothetical protein